MNNNISKKRYLTTLIGVIAASGVQAANNDIAEQEDKKIEEVRVWGTKVWASSLNIDEETFALKQSDHISDLLRVLPGVDVGGAHSMNQRITIRSMDDKDLRITIDGANQNTYMYHHMGNLQIHADILSSAEIKVGNNSVADGGLGGAVRFKTKSAQDLLDPGRSIGGRIQAGYATNAEQSFAVTGYGEVANTFDFLAYYNDVSRDDFKVGGGKILDAEGAEINGTDGEVRGFKGDLSDLLLKAGWRISDGQSLRLGYEAYTDAGDYTYRPDMGLATDVAMKDAVGGPLLWATEFTRDTLTLNYDLDLGDAIQLESALFSNKSTLERDESAWAEEGYPEEAGVITGEATNSGLNILARSMFLVNHLTYGIEYIEYKTDYYAAYPTPRANGEEAVNTAVFIEDKINLGAGFSIIPGIRYSSYDIDAKVINKTFSDVTAALALEVQPTNDLLVSVSGTQLFKGPEIGEVYIGAGLGDTENSDIKAESGTNIEYSVAWGSGNYNTGATIFKTTINDYIYDYAPNPEVRYWKDNIGTMVITGAEVYLGYSSNNIEATLTYSYADSVLDAHLEYQELDNARLDRVQGDTVSFNFDYDIPSINLAVHWDFMVVEDVDAGLDLDGATKDNSKDGFSIHSISAKWNPEFKKGISIILGIDNVFDEYYASQSSRTGVSDRRGVDLYLQDYEPGRNIKTTVSYTF